MEGSWPKFLAKNILKIILLTICISMMTFGLMKASPVDPLQANVGQAGTERKTGGILGRSYAAGPAVYFLGEGFCPGRYGDFPFIPAACNRSDRSKII